jgi:hypothetical protein
MSANKPAGEDKKDTTVVANPLPDARRDVPGRPEG